MQALSDPPGDVVCARHEAYQGLTTAWLLGDDRGYQAWLGRLVVVLARDQQTVRGEGLWGTKGWGWERAIGFGTALAALPPLSLDDALLARVDCRETGLVLLVVLLERDQQAVRGAGCLRLWRGVCWRGAAALEG
jgi:hypothetical protein